MDGGGRDLQWGQMPEISGKRVVRVGQGGGGSEPNGK